jgi:hypothetical protein
MNPPPDRRARGSNLERALAIGLRTLHLGAVVVLGASLLGAPIPPGPAGGVALASGLVLALLDLAARRMRLDELAGAVVIAKLAIVGWLAWGPASQTLALAGFWVLLVVSSLSAHAPKPVRHWRPGRQPQPDPAPDPAPDPMRYPKGDPVRDAGRDSKAGRPG